jgi:UDP-GlcNAc:undecaprenyl-phosphate GlcNAc-1-phosphate transferase
MILVAALLGFFVTILFMFALRPVADALRLVDIPDPNGRKRHGIPVPVIGGICMCVGLGFGSSLVAHPPFWAPMLLAIYLLVIIGVIDDRFDAPPSVRLIAQTCACLLVVFGADIVVHDLGTAFFVAAPLGPFALMFSVLFILTVINAFNVIDGIDGLAGGLAIISLAAMGFVGYGTDVFPVVVLLVSVVAAYLLFNLPLGFNKSVRTFMGDAGSTFLGLAIACLGIVLSQGEGARIGAATGLWLIAVPAFDFFSSVARRVLELRSPLAPDHEHLHHVLMVNGLSARATLAFLLACAGVCAAVGIIGDAMQASDGVMCMSWIVAGVLYYQMMRHPQPVVRLIRVLLPSATRKTARSA